MEMNSSVSTSSSTTVGYPLLPVRGIDSCKPFIYIFGMPGGSQNL